MAVGVGLLTAAPAQAGSYAVSACVSPAGKFPNRSWVVVDPGSDFDSAACETTAGAEIAVVSTANKTYPAGRRGTMTFTAPPGTTIADFALFRQLYQFNPLDGAPAGSQLLHTLLEIGGTPLEGTGSYDPTVMARLGVNWYGGGAAADTGAQVVTLRSFPAAAGYAGEATTLRYTVGCHTTGNCALMTDGVPRAGAIFASLRGATVTINDTTPPRIPEASVTGLRADAFVTGDEPVAFDATDGSGIKSAALVDITPGGPERVVGTREFTCDYTLASPCAQPDNAEIVPTGLAAGTRTLKVRVVDAGGNATESGPFDVRIGGPLNGTAAEAGAKLTARFARNRRGTLVLGFGKRARINGRLTTAAGAPIANATVQVLDRELRTGTSYRQQLEVTTGADGTFTVLAGKGAARAIRFEYRFRRALAQPDVARRVELRVKAASTLSISPRRVRPGGRIRISGRLRGLPTPRSGKVVELQALENGRWRDFRSTRARRSGRFATSYRFQRASSGSSFLIRARIRRDDSYPYYLGYSPRVRVRVR
jgi:hypothetical protein